MMSIRQMGKYAILFVLLCLLSLTQFAAAEEPRIYQEGMRLVSAPRNATATDSVTAITAAYITCDHSMLRVGEETVWTLHLEGAAADAYTFDYVLLYQAPTDPIDSYYSNGGSFGLTELSYAHTPTEQGRYIMLISIRDQYEGVLEVQSTFFVTVDDSSADSVALAQKVSEVVALCQESGAKSEYEIALFMHDYLISNAEYDLTYTYFFPDGVLLHGTGVCQSYATAYQILMEEMGVECVFVIGYAGEDHSWNMVNIDGEWYHVDCTWDDPVGAISGENHAYFCISDEMMALDHSWNEALYPACTSVLKVDTLVVLSADGQSVGEYASVEEAFAAAADLACTELDICITTGSRLLLPAGDWPDCAERITIRGETGTAIFFMKGDVTLHSNLRLENVILEHNAGLTFQLGGKRLEMAAAQFGNFNIDEENLDVGLAQSLYLVGGAGSELVVTGIKSEIYGNLTIGTLRIDDSQINLRGGNVAVQIDTLVAVNAQFYVGVSESADSVNVVVDDVEIHDAHYLTIMPIAGSKLTINNIAPTTGSLGFYASKLSGMVNWSETFTEMDIAVLSEYIPPNFSLFDYQYTTTSDRDVNLDAFMDYIPIGTRLMKIPHLDPNTAEVTLSLQILDANDWGTSVAYEHLMFAVELDDEGYAVRSYDRTQKWISDYFVLNNRDKTYAIINTNWNMHNIIFPSALNGVAVTGIGTFDPYLYNKVDVGPFISGSVVFPKEYVNMIEWIFSPSLTCAVFLGEKPQFDAATVTCPSDLPIFYLSKYAASWEEERGLPLVPAQKHEIDVGSMQIIPASQTAVSAEYAAEVQADTILLSPGCQTIESGAFAGADAATVFLPSTLTAIADDAFEGCADAVFFVDQDYCYAAYWAKAQGYTVYTVDLLSALVYGLCEHTWDDGVLSSVNCAENLMTYTCAKCGMTKSETIPTDIPHTWDEGTVIRRCTGDTQVRRCIYCDEEWIIYLGESTGSCTWNRRMVISFQTCTEAGEVMYLCAYCTNEKHVTIQPHFWSEGTLTAMPAGDAPGEMSYTCCECGATKSVSVAAGNPGDVNVDEQVDLLDVMALMEWYCSGVVELNLANGDVNGDGLVDMLDVIDMLACCDNAQAVTNALSREVE